jgi:hypothetical protein
MKFLFLSFLCFACSPVSLSRMGPSLPPRQRDCDILVLPPGATPDRPWRDVGLVSLKNCPEYEAGPCLAWLKKAACELGGDVAYQPQTPLRDGRPDRTAGTVTLQVTVAAFVAAVPPSPDDPVLNATEISDCDTPDGDSDMSPDDQMCKE